MKNTKLKTEITILKGRKFFRTMLLSGILFLLFSCTSVAQKNQELAENENDKIGLSDTSSKPKINFKVNKQYDKKGNIVKYDSTYSYVYSSKGNVHELFNDSMFNHSQNYFNMSSGNPFKNEFGIFKDSLFNSDPFPNLFFEKRFNLSQGIFDDVYKHLDSLRHSFYIEPEPARNRKKKA